MNNYIVYIHTNKYNNKKYIGITCRDPKIRWGLNGNGYSLQDKFFNAIKKYGWDNFNHDIVAKNLKEEEAKELETYYIDLYDTINNGYNVLREGINSYPKLKPVFCITTNKKYSSIKEAAIENNCLPTQIIKNCKGKRGPVKGLQWVYWNEELNQPNEIIPFIPKEKSNAQSIYCIELKKFFPSIGSAVSELSIDKRSLQRALNGERNGVNNLHFIKATELDKIFEVIRKDIGKQTRVYCHETNQVFPSIQEAASFCEKSPQTIMKNCQKKLNQCGPYHFDYIKNLSDEILQKIYGGIEEDA